MRRVGSDGLSTFHFKWTSRGLKPRVGQKRSRYRRNEAVAHVRYNFRDDAREVPGGGVVSNISTDPDAVASLFGAIEELEVASGHENANVYCSFVLSLPAEIGTEGRERVLCAVGEEIEKEELPFAIVLHKPDPRGDPLNFHAHGILSLRPFRKRADGSYDLAAASSADLNGGEWIYRLREIAARAMTMEAERAAIGTGETPRRFTHLSNRDRGLVEEPGRKRGPGFKDRERREEDLASMRAERDALDHYISQQGKFGALIDGLLAREVVDRADRIARQRARLAAIQATETAALVSLPQTNAPIGSSQSVSVAHSAKRPTGGVSGLAAQLDAAARAVGQQPVVMPKGGQPVDGQEAAPERKPDRERD